MTRKRSPVAMHPSQAQGLFIQDFEEAYFALDGGRTLETLPLGEPPVGPRERPSSWLEGVPRRTYLDWRRQKSSPTIWDLERLCGLVKSCQTLLIDPLQQRTGDRGMAWYERANELVAKLAGMEAEARGGVLARFEDAIEKAYASQGARNPLVPGAEKSGTDSRRS